MQTVPGPTYARHFHTFDALRFFAFLKVFLHHIPSAGFGLLANFMTGGTLAVRFFFVLSGFLITYLILAEKLTFGAINFKYFILRRALRIWPLYYLIVGFAFATPHILSALQLPSSDAGYEPNYFFTLTFLENYVSIVKGEAPNVSPLGVIWSICVEEHFYLLWGLILANLATRHIPKLVVASVLLAIGMRSLFVEFGYSTLDLFTNLDLFAAGAVPAYLLCVYPGRFEGLIDRVPYWSKVGLIAFVIAVVFVDPHVHGKLHDILAPTLLGVLFCALLALFLSRRPSFSMSDSNPLSRLGRYTYGLYLYHVIVINLLVVLFRKAGLPSDRLWVGILLMLIALSMSTVISAVSYRFFERPFLALRRYPGNRISRSPGGDSSSFEMDVRAEGSRL